MKQIKQYVGLNVTRMPSWIALANGGRGGEIRLYGTIVNDLHALEKVVRKVGGEGGELPIVQEAGPMGFVIYRRLRQWGIACAVVAPSKTPQATRPRQKGPARNRAAGAAASGRGAGRDSGARRGG
jgi:transposase